MPRRSHYSTGGGLSLPMTIISPGPRGNFFANARLPGSCVVGVWFDHVHGPNTKSTRIVDTLLMVSSSVRGTLVVRPTVLGGDGLGHTTQRVHVASPETTNSFSLLLQDPGASAVAAMAHRPWWQRVFDLSRPPTPYLCLALYRALCSATFRDVPLFRASTSAPHGCSPRGTLSARSCSTARGLSLARAPSGALSPRSRPARSTAVGIRPRSAPPPLSRSLPLAPRSRLPRRSPASRAATRRMRRTPPLARRGSTGSRAPSLDPPSPPSRPPPLRRPLARS